MFEWRNSTENLTRTASYLYPVGPRRGDDPAFRHRNGRAGGELGGARASSSRDMKRGNGFHLNKLKIGCQERLLGLVSRVILVMGRAGGGEGWALDYG